MRFADWLRENDMSTAEYPAISPGRAWQKLISWYDQHYQNLGGWKAVSQKSESDPQFHKLLSDIKQKLDGWKPHSPRNDYIMDDPDDQVEDIIDRDSQEIMKRMAATAPTQSIQPPPPPPEPLNQTRSQDQPTMVMSRVKSLEDRVAQMERLLKTLNPTLFSGT